jgi:predicted nucleic acid-binding protein
MAELLVDTDVIVDHLRSGEGPIPPPGTFDSAITRAELFAGRHADGAGLRRVLAPMGELPVDRSVAELGGRVRRESGVALPDALIAATAISHGLALHTRKRRHFERVPRLRLGAP